MAKKICIMIIVLTAISFIPLLILSFYSWPAMDDYNCGAAVHAAIMNQESFPDIIRAYFSGIRNNFLHLQGSFSSSILSLIHPGVWGTRCYFLTTWFMLGMFILGTKKIVDVFLVSVLQKSKIQSWAVTCILLFLTINFLPSVYEALYWFNGANHYILFQALMLWMISEIIRYFIDNKKKHMIISCLLALYIGGGNYNTPLILAEILIIIIIVRILMKKPFRMVFLPLAFLIFSFGLNVLSPGTAVRASETVGMGAVKSVIESIGEAYRTAGNYLNLFTVVILILLTPILYNAVKDASISFPLPLLVWGISFLLFASSFTPTSYALGTAVGPHRLRNMQYWLFVLLLVFCYAYSIGWSIGIAKQCSIFDSIQPVLKKLNQSYGVVCAIGIAGFLFVGMLLIPGTREIATTGAVYSLISGEAAAWKAENQKNEEVLLSEDSSVVIQTHHTLPILLDEYDKDGKPSDTWSVGKMEAFYQKEIRIE